MSSTLLQSATAVLTPDFVSRASAQLGEPEESVLEALSRGAVPTLLAGLAARAGQRAGAEQMHALLGDPAFDPRDARSPGTLFGDSGARIRDFGGRLLALWFDGRLDALTTALADFAGIRASSASSLLRVAAPLVLGVVAERVKRGGLDAAGLARLLAAEQGTIEGAVPPVLRSATGSAPPRTATAPPARAGSPRWLWPALALVAIVLLWTVLRGRDEPPVSTAPPPAETADVAARSIDWVTHRLPTGTEIRIPSNGIEVRLVGVLEGAGGSDEWFAFDRLLFEPDSANLRSESEEQLRNVAAILIAYPNARVQIGGYTDNAGDPAQNLRLSQERAANVKSSLVNLGVGADRLATEGFGEQDPIASNATETGRIQNRRVAMRVSQR